MSKVHYDHTTMSGIPEIPYDRHQIREYASILSNMILIYRLILHKMTAILYCTPPPTAIGLWVWVM